ncbi:hypothetical protein SB772_21935 [Paraburkholderia sp. SIMBA_030]
MRQLDQFLIELRPGGRGRISVVRQWNLLAVNQAASAAPGTSVRIHMSRCQRSRSGAQHLRDVKRVTSRPGFHRFSPAGQGTTHRSSTR